VPDSSKAGDEGGPGGGVAIRVGFVAHALLRAAFTLSRNHFVPITPIRP
jgi:hypothetical protein